MNKELTPLEAYNELKSYLEDILNGTCNSNAMRHTDSFMYLMPFIKQVETALNDYENLKNRTKNLQKLTCEVEKDINKLKAFTIIKEKETEKHNQEEHDHLSQLMNSHFMIFKSGRENGKSQMMFSHPNNCEPTPTSKKCVNCKYFRFILNYTVHSDKPHKTPMCCVKAFVPSKIYRFNKCKRF